MIRCALALIRSPERSMPFARRSSSSPVRTFGSITTPLPIAHFRPGYRMPLGIRWNFHLTSSRTIVWPALLPPWKRITRSACSASRSTTLPFPSSPHWAPTITRPAMTKASVGRRDPAALRALGCHPPVGAPHRQGVVADLAQARHGAPPDLAPQTDDRVEVRQLRDNPLEPVDDAGQVVLPPARARLAQLARRVLEHSQRAVGVGIRDVRGHDDRAPVLPALVDDRVELLQHPFGLLLRAQVVEHEHVDRAKAAEEAEVGVARIAVERALD